MSEPDQWIVIPSWDRYQHYKDRDPLWIKAYRDLLDRPEYLRLGDSERALLHDLWLLFARLDGVMLAARVPALRQHRTRGAHLTALVDAGFIDVIASKPLALSEQRLRARALSESREGERTTPPTPPAGGNGIILGQALPDAPWVSGPPPPLPKRTRKRNEDEAPQLSAPSAEKTFVSMLRWLQSTAFDPETMDEATVIEELEMRERKLRHKVTPQQRDELLTIARQKRERYSPAWEGEEP